MTNLEIQSQYQVDNKKMVRKAIWAGSIGNVMEWYDWQIYGYLSATISAKFFPSSNPTTALLATFATFALGFIMRPLGSLVLGPYGDKVGRSRVLALSVIFMGISTCLIGFLPTYAEIGIWSPILLVFFRLVQGFSAGVEWGGSTSFLVEYAPKTQRGYFSSWQQFSTGCGRIVAALMATFLAAIFYTGAFNAWGWRIGFIFGIVIAVTGLYLRLRIEDTPKFKEVKKEEKVAQHPMLEMFKHPKLLLITVGFTLSWTVTNYVYLTYMPSFMETQIHMSSSTTLWISLIVLAFLYAMVPFIGILSDKIGRKPILLISCAGSAVLTFPLFFVFVHVGGVTALLVSQLVLDIFLAMFSGAGPAALAELFPTIVRNSSLSFGYNIGVALFGGTAPLIATYLISITKSPLSPSIYVIISAVITFLVILLFTKDKYREELE